MDTDGIEMLPCLFLNLYVIYSSSNIQWLFPWLDSKIAFLQTCKNTFQCMIGHWYLYVITLNYAISDHSQIKFQG